MSETKRVYGIDLGTTYSAIAFIDEYGKAQVITNSDNERVTPSVVFFEEEGNIIVGKIAKETAKTDPGRVADFVKRQMSDKEWLFEVDGRSYTPEEVSSFILKRLAGDAEKTGEHNVEEVVITCPAYFGDLERERTRAAGKLAGLNVIEILDEPVAAAINYGLNDDAKGKNVIVYDLGGGTFDVTVVKIGNDPEKNEISIVCTEGNHQLGGKDWDDKVVNYYVDEFQSQTGEDADILSDMETAYDIRFNAETDKKTLATKERSVRRVSYEGEKANVELTREKFDELTEDLLEQTFTLTDKVIEEAKQRGTTQFHAFLLVGGSTRMKQIKEKVTERYGASLGITPVEFDVDEAVAKGAAKSGEIKIITGKVEEAIVKIAEEKGMDIYDLSVESKADIEKEAELQVAEEGGYELAVVQTAGKTTLKKVATKSYGIRALKNGQEVVRNLIVKQTPVPCEGSQVFGTAGPNADEIDLVVFSNDESAGDATADMSFELGQAVFQLDGNLPAKAPIEITFKLDEQGSLTLVGLDKTHGKTITAEFKADGVMTDEEIQEKIEASRDLVIE